MQFLSDLWLPILVSAVGVFVASSLVHMVIKWHNSDYKLLPAEEDVRAALNSQATSPGQYMVPHCVSMEAMGTPEMLKKYEEGPVGFLTLLPPGPPAIGKNLLQWFLYCVLVSLFCGYLASLSLGAGADYMAAFRVTGTVAVLAYGLGTFHDSIWKGVPWSVTLKFLVDGVVYGLVTAGVFGWLWPGA